MRLFLPCERIFFVVVDSNLEEKSSAEIECQECFLSCSFFSLFEPFFLFWNVPLVAVQILDLFTVAVLLLCGVQLSCLCSMSEYGRETCVFSVFLGISDGEGCGRAFSGWLSKLF